MIIFPLYTIFFFFSVFPTFRHAKCFLQFQSWKHNEQNREEENIYIIYFHHKRFLIAFLFMTFYYYCICVCVCVISAVLPFFVTAKPY